jgi:iron complex transport system substrate-binding protein
LWRIGAWKRVVGITSFFTLPPDCEPKPRVSGFSSARTDEITKLSPDLVITFSDVQAKLAAELVKMGFTVLATNQRSLTATETTLALIARAVGRERDGARLLAEFRKRLAPVKNAKLSPRIYFEEWGNPLVAGIRWIGELIERAGGRDIFYELRTNGSAAERVVSARQVCERDPEIILASWCGRPVRIDEMKARHGWHKITAVRNNQIYEIPGEDILQPGFRLVEGYKRIRQILEPLNRGQK